MLYREQFCEFEVKLSLAWFTNDKLFPLYRLQERVLDTSWDKYCAYFKRELYTLLSTTYI